MESIDPQTKRRGRPKMPEHPDPEWILGATAAARFAKVSRTQLYRWMNEIEYDGRKALEWGTDYTHYTGVNGDSGVLAFRRAKLLELGELAAINKAYTIDKYPYGKPVKPKRRAKRKSFRVLTGAEAAVLLDSPMLAEQDQRSYTGDNKPRWLREIEAAGVLEFRITTRDTPTTNPDGTRGTTRTNIVWFPKNTPEEVAKHIAENVYRFSRTKLPGDEFDPLYSKMRGLS